jgi:hypothetical protein
MAQASFEIHNPAYAKRSTADAVAQLPPPRRNRGDALRISFVDNEKPNTTRLLELVAADLAKDYAIQSRRYTKGGAGLPAPDEVIREAATDADLAILATCD